MVLKNPSIPRNGKFHSWEEELKYKIQSPEQILKTRSKDEHKKGSTSLEAIVRD